MSTLFRTNVFPNWEAWLTDAQCSACGLTRHLTRKWIENRLLVCLDAHCVGYSDPLEGF